MKLHEIKHDEPPMWRTITHQTWAGYDVAILFGDYIVHLDFEKLNHGEIVEPTLRSEGDPGHSRVEAFLRSVLNRAWDMGLRPDGYHDVRESMKATQAHLEDMRMLVFRSIGAVKQ